jgi:hypothetical protein
MDGDLVATALGSDKRAKRTKEQKCEADLQ